jgi:N-acetyltransferase B complex non-catalytic subunit
MTGQYGSYLSLQPRKLTVPSKSHYDLIQGLAEDLLTESLSATHQTQKFLEGSILRHPKLRNAQLAFLDLTAWEAQTGVLTEDALRSACEAYYDRNHDKLYCFNDLQKYLVLLGEDVILKFLKYVLKNVEDSSSAVEVRTIFTYC